MRDARARFFSIVPFCCDSVILLVWASVVERLNEISQSQYDWPIAGTLFYIVTLL